MPTHHPSLYQINTRVWLTELSHSLGRPATLDDIPDAELDRLAGLGFDWIYLLSVWATGPAAQRVSRNHSEWRREFEHALSDLRESDIEGSGFAISSYTVHRHLGGPAALARLRARMRQSGLRLMLDFVPNHMAPDHPWIEDHPDYFVPGNEADLSRSPRNYCRVETKRGPLLLAHGRDPYFDGWPDTLQLNYGHPGLQQAMRDELFKVAAQCDGVRCDMAMLMVPDVFERTWGIQAPPFWPGAIASVRQAHPPFVFMAEVYWDMEWTLQQQGFDYTYDKRLYDRLRERQARPVREHFTAGTDFQTKLARFMENHDEPRAAATFEPGQHIAAAVLTYLSPGLRFFHEGQLEGRKIRLSPHLVRRPDELADAQAAQLYADLLAVLRRPAVREGQWSLLECLPAWSDNPTSDSFIAFCWEGAAHARLCVVVNYSARPAQCFIRMQGVELASRSIRFKDLLGRATYDRCGDDLLGRGLFMDVPAWGCHVFEVQCLG